jgi:hypothetical protein
MTAIQRSHGKPFVTSRQAGNQARFDIVSIARELKIASQEQAWSGGEPLRILFDWSEVTTWPYQATPQTRLQLWRKMAPAVLRAAFVHNRRWDRQVALIAALLRSTNAEVRSFPPAKLDDAIDWLESDEAAASQLN